MKEQHSLTVFGRIARVQDVKDIGDTKVKNFVIVQTTKYKDKQFSTYFDCSIWGADAGNYEHLCTGMQVAAIGTVKAEHYVSKGEHRAKLVLRVNSLASGDVVRSY